MYDQGGSPPAWGEIELPDGPYAEPTVASAAESSPVATAPQYDPGPSRAPMDAAPAAPAPQVSLPMGSGGPAPARSVPVSAPQYLVHGAPPPLGPVDPGGHLLGVSTLLVGVGGLLGIRFGGLYGGVAGSLFGGAAVNAYRAVTFGLQGTPEADREMVVSGTYALLVAAVGGYVTWKIDGKAKGAKATPNPKAPSRNERRNCDLRPVGL